MKRILLVLAVAALALPTAAIAKGPSEASITGPGLGKAIKISGPESEGSPMMNFAEAAGFFPAAFSQQPNPLLPGRPKGDLGPRYKVDYTVPGPEGETFHVQQALYPYASPFAVTYMKSGQDLFRMPGGTFGGWYESTGLKDLLVKAGLPETAPTGTSSSAGFGSTGRLGAGLGGALLLAASAWLVVRRRPRRSAT
jgi:hypothetical protein